MHCWSAVPTVFVAAHRKAAETSVLLFRSSLTSPSSPLSTATTDASSSPSTTAWLDRSDSASSIDSLDWRSNSSSSISSSTLHSERIIEEDDEEEEREVEPPLLMESSTASHPTGRRALVDVTNHLPPLQLPHSQPLVKVTAERPRRQLLPALSPLSMSHLAVDHQLVLLSTQSRLHCYNPSAPYLPYRPLLLSWLLEVSVEALGLPPLTVHAAVALFDHLASSHAIPLPSLQLIGLTCVLLSCKFSLPFDCQPSMSHLLSLTPGLHRSHLCEAELAVLSRLHWNVDIITPTHFLEQWRAQYESQWGDALWEWVDVLDRVVLEAYDLREWEVGLLACGILRAARMMMEGEDGEAGAERGMDMGCEFGEVRVRGCARRVCEVYEAWHGWREDDGVEMREE